MDSVAEPADGSPELTAQQQDDVQQELVNVLGVYRLATDPRILIQSLSTPERADAPPPQPIPSSQAPANATAEPWRIPPLVLKSRRAQSAAPAASGPFVSEHMLAQRRERLQQQQSDGPPVQHVVAPLAIIFDTDPKPGARRRYSLPSDPHHSSSSRHSSYQQQGNQQQGGWDESDEDEEVLPGEEGHRALLLFLCHKMLQLRHHRLFRSMMAAWKQKTSTWKINRLLMESVGRLHSERVLQGVLTAWRAQAQLSIKFSLREARHSSPWMSSSLSSIPFTSSSLSNSRQSSLTNLQHSFGLLGTAGGLPSGAATPTMFAAAAQGKGPSSQLNAAAASLQGKGQLQPPFLFGQHLMQEESSASTVSSVPTISPSSKSDVFGRADSASLSHLFGRTAADGGVSVPHFFGRTAASDGTTTSGQESKRRVHAGSGPPSFLPAKRSRGQEEGGSGGRRAKFDEMRCMLDRMEGMLMQQAAADSAPTQKHDSHHTASASAAHQKQNGSEVLPPSHSALHSPARPSVQPPPSSTTNKVSALLFSPGGSLLNASQQQQQQRQGQGTHHIDSSQEAAENTVQARVGQLLADDRGQNGVERAGGEGDRSQKGEDRLHPCFADMKAQLTSMLTQLSQLEKEVSTSEISGSDGSNERTGMRSGWGTRNQWPGGGNGPSFEEQSEMMLQAELAALETRLQTRQTRMQMRHAFAALAPSTN